jgi:type I restriction enzyme, S subunit
MIEGLKPYAEYKESGVPWLGKIPKHWQALPNRTLFAEVKDRNHPDEPLLSVTIGKGIIRQSDLLANSSKKDSSNLDKAKYKLVQPHDIAYNKMRAWQGAVGVSNYRGIVSPAYIVVRPRGEKNPDYFHFLLRTPSFAKEAERWSYGITSDQWSLRAEDFKQIYCSLPPKDEQDRIVKFFVYMDHRINHLIRSKRQLIELLNEQKKAIIHHAVSRGIDPNVRLKNSGIDWLGDVAEHWNTRRLKQVVTPIEQGWSPQCDAQPAGEEEWGVLKVGCVNGDLLDVSQNKKLPPSLDPRPDLEINDGGYSRQPCKYK